MNKLFAYWWSPKRSEQKALENFGDEITPYLLGKISNKKVVWYNVTERRFYDFKELITVTGSIISVLDKRTHVWGNGLISKQDFIPPAQYYAVRGHYTKNLIKSKFPKIKNMVVGDPAVLLPRFFLPNVSQDTSIGIVPHYVDYDTVQKMVDSISIRIIDLTKSVEKVVTDILKCDIILSSSLHGLIVAHAYGKRAIWVKFSDKLYGDDIKFYDYFSSVDLDEYQGALITSEIQIIELSKKLKNGNFMSSSRKMEIVRENLIDNIPLKLI